ncbi:hypothetical protein MHI43_03070 [Paenibacillus sp. FSL H8-0457]|uniref:hypothetical protein n=1 Tax=unclassified Paenibacillus TaxID=185978 RepID=UPI0003E1C5C4|nr:hypothetical protein [Paenibacillus sp. FSL H8-457]ETT59800.1 hypothetical protein C172_23238 [Paenibacillus sp. FSL H8-457]
MGKPSLAGVGSVALATQCSEKFAVASEAASRNELRTAAAVSIGPQIRYFHYGLVFTGSIGHMIR